MGKLNEFQEAMDVIVYAVQVKFRENEFTWENYKILYSDKIAKIQELIDKETPIKPIKKHYNTHGHIMYGTCDMCKSHEPIFFGHRCSNNDCGQKQDWSDEE